MRTERFMYFCIQNYTGTRVKFVDSKNIFNPPVVYATDRSKAVVPALFLFCVALWFILQGASCFKSLPCSLSSCFFIPSSIVITSHEEEGPGLCVCLFVLHVLVFCPFSFPLGVGGWLRL